MKMRDTIVSLKWYDDANEPLGQEIVSGGAQQVKKKEEAVPIHPSIHPYPFQETSII